MALEFAKGSVREDASCVLAAVRQDGTALQFVHRSFCYGTGRDPDEYLEVAMAAVRSNPEALEFVRSELRVKTAVAIAEKALADNDEPPGERAEEVCSSAFETQISALPPDIREDFDFVAGVLLCLRDALNRGKRMP